MQTKIIQFTRQQLYNEIWIYSVAGVAKKYGIPYHLLMRQVKDAAIPYPPSGYWTKLSFGKPVEQTALTGPADQIVQLPQDDSLITSDVQPRVKALHESTHLQDIIVRSPASKPSIASPLPETVMLSKQSHNIYDRETLYAEVWSSPVTEIAQKYSISDVAIQKVCKSLNIPTPGKGYWEKLRAGKPVAKIPLPASGNTKKPTSTVRNEALGFLSPEDSAIILAVASQILLPDESEKMHPQIVAHRKKIAQWQKQHGSSDANFKNRHHNESAPFLVGAISNESIPRACRIIDALIKALEPLGCELTPDLSFKVSGETVSIVFSEAQDKVKHVPTKDENLQLIKYQEEKKRYSWVSKPQMRQYDYIFSGRLSITIESQKSFRDTKTSTLESRLGEIVPELYLAAESRKQKRLAQEEAERKRREEREREEERRKRYNQEVDYTLALINLAEDYATACKIRSYIAAVEETDQTGEFEEWVKWAKAKADWYDPNTAAEDPFFGKRAHAKNAGFKQLTHKYG